MATSIAMPFLSELLRKYIIIWGSTRPLAVVDAFAHQIYTRANYVLLVLNATPATRDYVRNLCLASSEPGQQQLAGILTLFEALPAAKKTAFIKSFKKHTSLTADGLREIALQTVWEPGHIPPILPP